MSLLLFSGASNQTGAAIGTYAFSAIGPLGVVAVRQVMAAAMLLPTVRPRFDRFTWAQWWPVLLHAAGCWAAYILLNRLVGRRLPGLQGTATACRVSAMLFLPVMVTLAVTGRLGLGPIAFAAAAGVPSSVVPFAIDLTALRTIPARFFGIFMSVNPVLGRPRRDAHPQPGPEPA